MPANHALYVRPLRIHRGGVIVSGMDWEHFSFANPGDSVAEFLRWSDGNLDYPLEFIGGELWMSGLALNPFHLLR